MTCAVVLEYDKGDRVISESDNFSSYTYDAYTADDLLKSVTTTIPTSSGDISVVLTSTYDNRSRRDSLKAEVNGVLDFTNKYSYTARDQMKQIVQEPQALVVANPAAYKRVELTYDGNDRIDSIARYESGNDSGLVSRTQYAYDADSRLRSLTHFDQLGLLPLETYSFEYYQDNKLKSLTTQHGEQVYVYDGAGQVTSSVSDYMGTQSYAYDGNGNRTSEMNIPQLADIVDGTSAISLDSYAVGSDNRYQNDGEFEYGYDTEGNLTTRTRMADDPADDYKTIYTWDMLNRLTGVEFQNKDAVTTKQVSYTYDMHNRRIAKDVDTDGDGTIDEGQRFIYDVNTYGKGGLDDVVIVLDRAGQVTERYLHGPDVDQLLAVESVGLTESTVTWALSDHLGTVRDLVELQSDGTSRIVMTRTFDAFGNIVSESDPTNPDSNAGPTTDYAFTGREWDPDALLYYYRARWYSPDLGQFVSEDPIGLAAGDANTRRYVGNAATNMSDPSGLEEKASSYQGGSMMADNRSWFERQWEGWKIWFTVDPQREQTILGDSYSRRINHRFVAPGVRTGKAAVQGAYDFAMAGPGAIYNAGQDPLGTLAAAAASVERKAAIVGVLISDPSVRAQVIAEVGDAWDSMDRYEPQDALVETLYGFSAGGRGLKLPAGTMAKLNSLRASIGGPHGNPFRDDGVDDELFDFVARELGELRRDARKHGYPIDELTSKEKTGPYDQLVDPSSVGPGKDFTSDQKVKIKEATKEWYGGSVISAKSGEELLKPAKSQRGVTPPQNEWQIDHIESKDAGGSNSYRNAQVLSRAENRAKSNK